MKANCHFCQEQFTDRMIKARHTKDFHPITQDEINSWKTLRDQGTSFLQIGKLSKRSPNSVRTHLQNISSLNRSNYHLLSQDIQDCRSLLEQGQSHKQVAFQLKRPVSTISYILKRYPLNADIEDDNSPVITNKSSSLSQLVLDFEKRVIEFYSYKEKSEQQIEQLQLKKKGLTKENNKLAKDLNESFFQHKNFHF